MGDGEGRELLFQLDGQHVGNGVRGAPVARDHKADALRYRLEPWLNQVWETVTPQPPGTTRTAT